MEHPEKFDISAYCKRMEEHLGNQEGDAKVFWQALSFAVDAHEGQKRKSGEIYVSHPCQVALILTEELQVKDPETLAAAILHDTVEDVPEVTNEVIGEIFGENIEAIVAGCTKISHFSGDRQTFYKLVHRKIFSEAASRLEIMLIKLADRLHNLRTLDSMPRHKRQKIAEESLDIYAPLAAIMGLYELKRELYDLALTYKFPRQSHKVLNHIRQLAADDEVLKILREIQEEMRKAWLNAEVTLRSKGLWAYYVPVTKLLVKIIDYPLEISIKVDDIQSCYRALGIINQKFPPIPRTIRNFIANPKPSGYQSLHARANINGRMYLFKIRTAEMVRIAKSGIINEWSLHRKVPSSFEKELRETFDILGTNEGLSYREVIAATGRKEIYTYTPKGDLICLPRQSTVLDFAFKVHTEIGSRCVAAMVAGQKVKPDHILKDGDQIRVICQKQDVHFDPQMQGICQSPKARSELARMFRIRRMNLAIKVGRSILKQELKRYGIPFEVLLKDELADTLEYFKLEDIDDLFMQVGEGRLQLKELIERIKKDLYAGHDILQRPTGALNRVELANIDPACIKLSRCCNPVSTEKGLMGLLSERGLSVHRKECLTFQSLKLQREDVVQLRWDMKRTPVTKPQVLLVLAASRNRVLMILSVAPEEMKVTDISSLSLSSAKQSAWEINFRVRNLLELRNVLHHFSKSNVTYEFVLEQ